MRKLWIANVMAAFLLMSFGGGCEPPRDPEPDPEPAIEPADRPDQREAPLPGRPDTIPVPTVPPMPPPPGPVPGTP